jgi:prephenate dehydrogenase
MKSWETVAIIGVGLIGGSVGMALRRRGLARRVIGVGRSPASLQAAVELGAIDQGTTDLAQGVANAELAVVCAPVGQIVALTRALAQCCQVGALATDVGSTKQAIVAELDKGLPRGVRFVGSHPLAGGHRTGPTAATAELFEGRLVVITPTPHTAAADQEAIAAFWRGLGARVAVLSPREHDEILATTSHAPHVVAAALAAATPAALLPYTSTGWADATRIAAGDARLWQELLLSNREHVLEAIARFRDALARFETALAANDASALEQLLSDARKVRDALGN